MNFAGRGKEVTAIDAVARHARGEINVGRDHRDLSVRQSGHTAEFELTEEQSRKRRAGSEFKCNRCKATAKTNRGDEAPKEKLNSALTPVKAKSAD
jgi:hypothetical protein